MTARENSAVLRAGGYPGMLRQLLRKASADPREGAREEGILRSLCGHGCKGASNVLGWRCPISCFGDGDKLKPVQKNHRMQNYRAQTGTSCICLSPGTPDYFGA